MKLEMSWRTKKHPAPNRKMLEAAMLLAAELCGLPQTPEWVLAVDFVGDRAMAAANAGYVGHTGTTDVITFSYFDGDAPVFEGDVGVELLVCTDVAAREGATRPAGYAGELMLYLVHGLLHSAGEDDLTEEAAKSMRRREAEVLSGLAGFDFNAIFPASA